MKNFTKIILSNPGGFSLIQVMIAAGLMGGLALGMMQMNRMAIKTSKDMGARHQKTGLHADLLLVLSDPLVCKQAFWNNGEPAKVKRNGDLTAEFDQIRIWSQVIAEQGNVYASDTKVKDMSITLISSEPIRENEEEATFVATVKAELEKFPNRGMRLKPLEARFYAVVNKSNQIIRCYSEAPVSGEAICEELGPSWSWSGTECGRNCNFNGNTVSNGGTVTAYRYASVPNYSSCSLQTRTCSNGTLSGSYRYPSCTVQAPPPPRQPPVVQPPVVAEGPETPPEPTWAGPTPTPPAAVAPTPTPPVAVAPTPTPPVAVAPTPTPPRRTPPPREGGGCATRGRRIGDYRDCK